MGMAPSTKAFVVFSCLAICQSLHTRAQDSNALPTLDALVRQWVALRQETAAETRVWQEQESQWRTEIALVERERDALTAEIAAASIQQQTHAESQLAISAREARLETMRQDLLPILDRAEADLRRWPPRIPPPLMPPLADGFARLPATHAEALQVGAARRLQLILSLYAQLEDLNQRVHATKQMLDDGSGGRREMDVLYLGLSRGYAVSADNQWAAVGIPATDGWRWEAHPEIGKTVSDLIAMQRRERAPMLNALPLQVVDGTQ